MLDRTLFAAALLGAVHAIKITSEYKRPGISGALMELTLPPSELYGWEDYPETEIEFEEPVPVLETEEQWQARQEKVPMEEIVFEGTEFP